jgi:prenyltransferase beta subunit
MVSVALFAAGLLLSFLGSTLIVSAQSPALANGLNYLQATQNAEGSWGAPPTPATPLHTTSTVLETLKILVAAPTHVADGEAWLAVQSVNTTRYAAWKVLALAGTSRDITAEVAWLMAVQNGDGGWGGAAEFTSDPFSTAVVLLALSRVGGVTPAVFQNGATSLLSTQRADGGWEMVEGEGSHVYVTASVLQILQSQPKTTELATALSKGVAYLKGQQGASGSWGSVFLRRPWPISPWWG